MPLPPHKASTARNEDDVTRKLIAALAAHPASDPIWRRLQKGPYKRFFARLKARVEAGPLSLELAPDAGRWATLAEATAEAIERLGVPWLMLVDELVGHLGPVDLGAPGAAQRIAPELCALVEPRAAPRA